MNSDSFLNITEYSCSDFSDCPRNIFSQLVKNTVEPPRDLHQAHGVRLVDVSKPLSLAVSGLHCGRCVSSCAEPAWLLQGTWDLGSLTMDLTLVPSAGMWILNHWATREVLEVSFNTQVSCPSLVLSCDMFGQSSQIFWVFWIWIYLVSYSIDFIATTLVLLFNMVHYRQSDL